MTTWQAEPLPLFQTPEWARLIGVFDLETTGIDVENDRIVTAHVGVLDVDGHVVDARDWLADKGYDAAYGARPLKRVIQKAVQDRLAEQLLAGTIHDGESVPVRLGPLGLTVGDTLSSETRPQSLLLN